MADPVKLPAFDVAVVDEEIESAVAELFDEVIEVELAPIPVPCPIPLPFPLCSFPVFPAFPVFPVFPFFPAWPFFPFPLPVAVAVPFETVPAVPVPVEVAAAATGLASIAGVLANRAGSSRASISLATYRRCRPGAIMGLVSIRSLVLYREERQPELTKKALTIAAKKTDEFEKRIVSNEATERDGMVGRIESRLGLQLQTSCQSKRRQWLLQAAKEERSCWQGVARDRGYMKCSQKNRQAQACIWWSLKSETLVIIA